MFFLLRSACCIGLVVATLPAAGPGQGPSGVFGAAKAMAVDGAGRFCQASPARCRDLVAAAARPRPAKLFLALAAQARVRASNDTLTAADRQPAWSAPPDRSVD